MKCLAKIKIKYLCFYELRLFLNECLIAISKTMKNNTHFIDCS